MSAKKFSACIYTDQTDVHQTTDAARYVFTGGGRPENGSSRTGDDRESVGVIQLSEQDSWTIQVKGHTG